MPTRTKPQTPSRLGRRPTPATQGRFGRQTPATAGALRPPDAGHAGSLRPPGPPPRSAARRRRRAPQHARAPEPAQPAQAAAVDLPEGDVEADLRAARLVLEGPQEGQRR